MVSDVATSCHIHSHAGIELLQAYKLQQKNKVVLVDVREAKYYDKQHAAGCVNVGLFRAVQGRTRLDNLKRLAMAGFAMEATGVLHNCNIKYSEHQLSSSGSCTLGFCDVPS